MAQKDEQAKGEEGEEQACGGPEVDTQGVKVLSDGQCFQFPFSGFIHLQCMQGSIHCSLIMKVP